MCLPNFVFRLLVMEFVVEGTALLVVVLGKVRHGTLTELYMYTTEANRTVINRP